MCCHGCALNVTQSAVVAIIAYQRCCELPLRWRFYVFDEDRVWWNCGINFSVTACHRHVSAHQTANIAAYCSFVLAAIFRITCLGIAVACCHCGCLIILPEDHYCSCGVARGTVTCAVSKNKHDGVRCIQLLACVECVRACRDKMDYLSRHQLPSCSSPCCARQLTDQNDTDVCEQLYLQA